MSENPVLSKMVDSESGEWNNHVRLSLWADFMVLAPVTAKTMAKMTAGECDNLLLAIYLSAKCPVYFAPAMDLDMYKHPSTKENISKLESYGNILIPSRLSLLECHDKTRSFFVFPISLITSLYLSLVP